MTPCEWLKTMCISGKLTNTNTLAHLCDGFTAAMCLAESPVHIPSGGFPSCWSLPTGEPQSGEHHQQLGRGRKPGSLHVDSAGSRGRGGNNGCTWCGNGVVEFGIVHAFLTPDACPLYRTTLNTETNRRRREGTSIYRGGDTERYVSRQYATFASVSSSGKTRAPTHMPPSFPTLRAASTPHSTVKKNYQSLGNFG